VNFGTQTAKNRPGVLTQQKSTFWMFISQRLRGVALWKLH